MARMTALADWLTWRVNRLRCMSAGEIAHRLRRAFAIALERWRLPAAAGVPPADLARCPAPWFGVPDGLAPEPYRAAAERLLAGRFDLFALHDVCLGTPPHWNRDPKSGIEAPATFGKRIDYRDPARVGDIKYLWEPNRHQHLVTLAQAWALSGDRRYADTLRAHLDDWFVRCPPGFGPNWASALEAGLRLINWSLAWQLLGGARGPLFADAPGAAFRQRWLDSVYRHARFIRGYFSLHSSANNHLIGEAAGLFIAALTWPHWPEAGAWRDEARAILEREVRLQNAPDGVNREQSSSYQQYEIDLLLLAWCAAGAEGPALSGEYRAIVERMLEYLASIMDAGGHVPMFGDADDGIVVRLVPGADAQRYRSVLATGAILFGRGDFLRKAGGIDDKTRWLLGAAARRPPPEDGRPLPVRRAFPDGGYYLLGRDFESADEIRLIVDAGPLGYQRIAAHGHADALSFVLSVGGQEFLIDPGTYAYHTQPAWRAYFRGTSAHNGLRVDGQDQSLPGGNFLWLHHAAAGCDHWRSSEREDCFEGWHHGYRRLDDPVAHRRRIVFDKAARRFDIDDILLMREAHDIELFFHCAEACRVTAVAGGYRLEQAGRAVTLLLPGLPGARHGVLTGSTEPILGWVSRRFDEKTPTATIRWHARCHGVTRLRTRIVCPAAGAPA